MLSWISPLAWAQSYPSKPIKAIVPFAPGSATDTIGRAFATKMSEELGQTIIVDNKPGVNGMLGAEAVAKSPADGYTILVGTNSTDAALKSLMKKLPYDQDTAFAPVGYMGSVPLIVGINPNLPYKTLREFVDAAKAKRVAPAGQTPRMPTHLLWLLLALFCTVLGHHGLQPMMVKAKAGEATPLSFGQLHGISSSLFLVKALALSAFAWVQLRALSGRPQD